jgi:hypothetical protein
MLLSGTGSLELIPIPTLIAHFLKLPKKIIICKNSLVYNEKEKKFNIKKKRSINKHCILLYFPFNTN